MHTHAEMSGVASAASQKKTPPVQNPSYLSPKTDQTGIMSARRRLHSRRWQQDADLSDALEWRLISVLSLQMNFYIPERRLWPTQFNFLTPRSDHRSRPVKSQRYSQAEVVTPYQRSTSRVALEHRWKTSPGADAQDVCYTHAGRRRRAQRISPGAISISPDPLSAQLQTYNPPNQRNHEEKHIKDYKVKAQSEPGGPYGSFPFRWLWSNTRSSARGTRSLSSASQRRRHNISLALFRQNKVTVQLRHNPALTVSRRIPIQTFGGQESSLAITTYLGQNGNWKRLD